MKARKSASINNDDILDALSPSKQPVASKRTEKRKTGSTEEPSENGEYEIPKKKPKSYK